MTVAGYPLDTATVVGCSASTMSHHSMIRLSFERADRIQIKAASGPCSETAVGARTCAGDGGTYQARS
jgi:hypothetical protein